MKNLDEIKEFITLRAKGWSFDKISKKMDASKPTLIKWNKQFRKEISAMRCEEIRALVEQYKAGKVAQIELMAKKLESVYNTIEGRELWHLSLKEILILKDNLEKNMEREIEKLDESSEIPIMDAYAPPVEGTEVEAEVDQAEV